MTDYDFHEVSYSGTTTEDWDAPQTNDFGTDDLSEIADHFLLSATGFPPANFTDLRLPVVAPDGSLNENAMQTAHGGAHGVASIDGVDDDTAERVREYLDGLSREAFGAGIGD